MGAALALVRMSGHSGGMDRQKLAYIALVLTIIYGGLFAVIGADARAPYAAIGGLVVGLMWVSVGVLGKDKDDPAPR